MILKQIYKKIKAYDTIIIHGHSRPDGDCYGAQFGLSNIIKNAFPKKQVYVVGEETAYVSFVGKPDIISDEVYINALSIVVDTATKDRISDQRYVLGKEIIKIDHHIPVDNYGHLRWVDTSFPSCAQMIAYDVYILIHHKQGFESSDNYGLKVGSHITRVMFAQGPLKNILVAVNTLDQVYMAKADIIADMDKPWTLINDQEKEIITFTPTIQEAFTVEDALNGFINQHQKLPTTELSNAHIYTYHLPDYAPYQLDYSVALSIYGVVLLVSLYFVFMFKPKKRKSD